MKTIVLQGSLLLTLPMSKDRGVSTDYAFGKEDVKVVSLQESLEIDYGIIYLKKGRNKLLKEFIECFNK